MNKLFISSLVSIVACAGSSSCLGNMIIGTGPVTPTDGIIQNDPFGTGENQDKFANVQFFLSGNSFNVSNLTLLAKWEEDGGFADDGDFANAFSVSPDSGNKKGTLTYDGSTLNDGTNTFQFKYFTLKSSGRWNVWEVMADSDTNVAGIQNNWSTDTTHTPSNLYRLLNNSGKNVGEISHISFWGVTSTSPGSGTVPEPTSMLMFASATVLLSTRRRRR